MSVEEYIEKCPKERQAALIELRQMVLEAFPHLEETLQYKMPTYVSGGEAIFSFANQKSYLAFYVCGFDLSKEAPDVYSKYNCGKSCIRFRKWDQEVKLDLMKVGSSMLQRMG